VALKSFCKHVCIRSHHSWKNFARVIAVSYLLTMLPIQGVLAQTWLGPNLTGLWDDDNNWSGNVIPGPGQVGLFDTSGNTVTVVNPATVGEINFTASPNIFNINSDFTLDAAGITGSQAGNVKFTINPLGTLAFTNAATAAGAAITNNGVVNITGITAAGTSIGSLSGTGSVNLGANDLTLGALGLNDLLSGDITGSGSLIKTGIGNLTLTGNSSYSGRTIVQKGTLTVNGALTESAVSVASGATIMGTGRMSSLDLEGIIAPGNSIGTLTIMGDFTMTSSSQYNAEVSSSGASDLIAVGGVAQLNGTLNVLSSDTVSSLSGKTYTILTAGNGVAGQFNSTGFNNNVRSNIYNVSYNPQSVSITFPTVDQVTPRVRVTERLLVEQQAWAPVNVVSMQQTTIVQNEPLGESGGACAAAFPVAFNKLVERQKSLALNSRGIIPSVGRKKRYVETPDVETRVIPISEKIKIGKTNVWMQNYDQASWLKGSAGATGKTYGGALGADYEIFKNTFLGFFGGSSISPIHMKSGLGKSQVKSYYGGVYATYMTSFGTYVSGQTMGGGNSYNSHRNINFGNFNLKAHSKHRGGQFFSRVEVGQVVPLSVVVVLPFINAGYGLVHEQKAIEKGAGLYNFATNRQNAQSMQGQVGARIYRTYNIMETFIRPEFDISYILTRGVGSRNGKGHFVGDPLMISLPGGHRTLNQVAPGFSLSALFKEGLFIIGGVNSQLSGTLKTVGATATVGYNF
jgi:autotransporter-associated beta strand protein